MAALHNRTQPRLPLLHKPGFPGAPRTSFGNFPFSLSLSPLSFFCPLYISPFYCSRPFQHLTLFRDTESRESVSSIMHTTFILRNPQDEIGMSSLSLISLLWRLRSVMKRLRYSPQLLPRATRKLCPAWTPMSRNGHSSHSVTTRHLSYFVPFLSIQLHKQSVIAWLTIWLRMIPIGWGGEGGVWRKKNQLFWLAACCIKCLASQRKSLVPGERMAGGCQRDRGVSHPEGGSCAGVTQQPWPPRVVTHGFLNERIIHASALRLWGHHGGTAIACSCTGLHII